MPLENYPREEAQLANGAATLAGEPRKRQSGLARCNSKKGVAERLDLGRNRAEKGGALFERHKPVRIKRIRSSPTLAIDIRARAYRKYLL